MITVLMGCPGAGKSTWIEANKLGHEHIYSTQAVRTNRELDRSAYMLHIRVNAKRAIASGLSVIADGTHTYKAHRAYWLQLAKQYNQETKLIVIDTALQVALAHNSVRMYPAPARIVKEHWIRCQRALQLIGGESWESIEIIKRGYP